MTDLAGARALLAMGFSVIPIPRPRPDVRAGAPGDGKVPAIAWREFQQRQPTDEELCAGFGGEPMNIAIVTGAVSGVVVIDADSPAAVRYIVQRLPRTPWQTKTPKGFHFYYLHPGSRIPNRAKVDTGNGRIELDVRGDGGYVIAPGSLHASGATYEEAGDWSAPRSEVPVFWRGWLEHRRPPAARRTSTTPPPPVGLMVQRARRYLESIPRPEIGAGSDAATLYAACRLVRGFGLSPSDAEALLWEWAGNRAGWDREWIARKVANAEKYGTEPIGAMA